MNYFNKISAIALLAFSLFTFSQVSAQQLPLYSSYVYNQLLLSPSFAGDLDNPEQSARLMLAHRYQYAGFEGAPTTSLLALDGPINSQNMGLGGVLYTDKMGLIRQTGLQLAYSYKVALGEKVDWRLGLSANVGQQGLDMASVRAADINENILNLESANKVFASGSFGTHISTEKLTLGASLQQLTQNRVVFQNYTSNVNFEYDQPMHLVGFGAYDIDLKGDTFGITPMVAVRYTAGTQLQYDAILKAHYKQKLFITAGYRGGYAASFGVGANLSNGLTLSYTYDHMINDAGPFTGGGNEFTLGYRFFRGKGAAPLQNSQPTVINNGLTQEQVDRMFNERVQTMRDRMDQLAQENQNQKDQIQALHRKIDSLHMTQDEMTQAAATVQIKDGFVANDLQFATNSAKLTSLSEAELDKIAAYLILNADTELSISGHTDNTGSKEGNEMISKMRARAVYDYLAARGIDKARMQHQGYGDTKPIASNATQQGRDQNRRVELKIR